MKTTRICALILTLSLLLSSVSYAGVETDVTTASRGEFVDSDTAAIVAMLIVAESVNNRTSTNWTTTTRIKEIITLYAPDNTITGYCITLITNGLKTGYITVSAWSGYNLVTEFSDSAVPVFEASLAESQLATQTDRRSERVYYMGGLSYVCLPNGESATMQSNTNRGADFQMQHEYSAECVKMNTPLLDSIRDAGIVPADIWMASSSPNTSGGQINDPLDYLENVYGSESYNYEAGRIISGVPNYSIPDDMACTVAAIAAVIYTNRQDIINGSNTYNSIYETCLYIGQTTELYDMDYGVQPQHNDDLANAILENYNSTWEASTYNNSFVSRGVDEIMDDRALIMSIAFGYYASHSVTVCGYCSYSNSFGDRYTFFKVKDGWNSSADRYVCMNGINISVITTITP